MVFPIAFFLGAAFGWYRARVRGGDRLDKLQYAAVHGILFTVATLIALVIAQRAGLI